MPTKKVISALVTLRSSVTFVGPAAIISGPRWRFLFRRQRQQFDRLVGFRGRGDGSKFMFRSLPEWKTDFIGFVQQVLQHTIDHLSLLADGSQLNRRIRTALKAGRTTRASYLAVRHHQRRLARRREIRRLVEGPVAASTSTH